jgi:hypothetical protein
MEPISKVQKVKWAESLLKKPLNDMAKSGLGFYHGDHWQRGYGWIGPRPEGADDDAGKWLDLLKKGFVSKNIVKEVCDRHASAVVSREVAWNPVAIKEKDESAETVAQIALAKTILTDWWTKQHIQTKLMAIVAKAVITGRQPVRLRTVSTAFRDTEVTDDDGNVTNLELLPQDDPAKTIHYFAFEAPEPTDSVLVVDKKTGEKIGVVRIEEDADILRSKTKRTLYEFHYFNEDGNTIVEVIEVTKSTRSSNVLPASVSQNPASTVITVSSGDTDTDVSEPLELDGTLLMYQLEREPLISPQVIENQKLYNMAHNMMKNNAILAGFLERIITNAELPGEWVEDKDAPDGRRFQRTAFKVGAGKTAFVKGQISEDSTGKETASSVGVYYRDPITPESLIATKTDATAAIYDEVKQGHILLQGASEVGGLSRVVLIQDFDASVQTTKTQVDYFIIWLLETVLKLAAKTSNTPDAFNLIRINAECRIKTVPLTPDEQRVAKELGEAGYLSRATVMSRIGVEDTEAEEGQIAEERELDLGPDDDLPEEDDE